MLPDKAWYSGNQAQASHLQCRRCIVGSHTLQKAAALGCGRVAVAHAAAGSSTISDLKQQAACFGKLYWAESLRSAAAASVGCMKQHVLQQASGHCKTLPDPTCQHDGEGPLYLQLAGNSHHTGHKIPHSCSHLGLCHLIALLSTLHQQRRQCRYVRPASVCICPPAGTSTRPVTPHKLPLLMCGMRGCAA